MAYAKRLRPLRSVVAHQPVRQRRVRSNAHDDTRYGTPKKSPLPIIMPHLNAVKPDYSPAPGLIGELLRDAGGSMPMPSVMMNGSVFCSP